MSHGESHREAVGGMWDEIGKLQFDFMVKVGLKPHHKLLDIGCGSLRGGVHFIKYLEKSNYYGVDKDHWLVDAGMKEEIGAKLYEEKLPRTYITSRFDFGTFDASFDFAIAQSLFTHLPWNSIAVCLKRARDTLANEGRLYATFFSSGDYANDWFLPISRGNGIVTFPDRDPYHYEPTMLMGVVHGLDDEYIGDWNHPRGQHMMEYTRR